jgi:hypothetical protein
VVDVKASFTCASAPAAIGSFEAVGGYPAPPTATIKLSGTVLG